MSTAATPRAKTPAPPRPRPRILQFWDSSIGKKVIVAVTGFVLVGYVVLHMVGNLAALSGPSNADDSASIDRYAHFLRTFGTPLFPYSFVLWVIRVALFAALVVHVIGIVQLRRRNSHASPQANRRIGRSWASRTMYFTGPAVLAFLIFHILMFTSLTIDIGGNYEEGAVYHNLYLAFNTWWVVLIYVVSVLSVGYHLRHGIWSAVQTLGFDSPRRNKGVRLYSTGIAFAVTVGFLIPPVLMWAGALPSPVRGA